MQSLDRIENKMDKETKSSKSRSHRSHDERRKTRSVDGNPKRENSGFFMFKESEKHLKRTPQVPFS
jgi:hypothetical protein